MPQRANLPVRLCHLGRAEYRAAAQLQRSLRAAREAGAIDDVLLLVEHDPVITCGTRTEPNEVAYARTTSIPLVPVERGGKATYHGPGQVVAYPIFDLSMVDGDVKELVWRLEAAIIGALAEHGLESDRRVGYPGVWVDLAGPRPRKVASVGLRLTRGVTFHGIAINVACDLTPFGWFTPCGIADAEMTSLARELEIEDSSPEDLAVLVRSVEASVAEGIAQRFGLDVSTVHASELADVARAHPVEDPDVSLPGEPRMRGASRIDIGARVPVGASS
ncbi:MAG: lipB [Thermoleophilia bacterium]|nr:lipB [Thermoleophilia bacterium]